MVLAACEGRLDRDRLAGDVHEAHAHAAEARLLGELRDRGALPDAFREVHRAQLADKIDELADDLAKPAEDESLDEVREATRRLLPELSALVRADHDTARARRFERALEQLDHEVSP
jgi:hypothetical protein